MRDLLTDAAREAPAGTALAAEVIDGRVRLAPATPGAEVVGFMFRGRIRVVTEPMIPGGIEGGIDVGLGPDDIPPAGTPVYFHPELQRLVLESVGEAPAGFVIGTAPYKIDGKLRRAVTVKLFRLPRLDALVPAPVPAPEPEKPAPASRARRSAAK